MTWKRLQNLQLRQRLIVRAKIISLVREFFVKEGFLEVETPIAVPAAGQEPYLNPNETELWDHRSLKIPAYLITSPEYAHKKLLAAGFKKTFEITRCFRSGEPWDGLHNPEFTMIEWYRAHSTYLDIMQDVESMVQYVLWRLHKSPRAKSEIRNPKSETNPKVQKQIFNIEYKGKIIDPSSPWQRLTMREAWEKYAKIPKRAKLYDREFLRELCRKRSYATNTKDTYDDLFFKIFLTEIEPKLGFPKPTILYEYPAQMAALARLKSSDPRFAERFEIYIAGIELGNAFSELTNAQEQRARFLEEQKLRKKLGKTVIPLDEDFLNAVGHMPPSAGIAFGIDRLVMLLAGAKSIEGVLAFPAKHLFKYNM